MHEDMQAFHLATAAPCRFSVQGTLADSVLHAQQACSICHMVKVPSCIHIEANQCSPLVVYRRSVSCPCSPCVTCSADHTQGARTILAAEGVRGLYKGLLPTLMRDVPEIAIQFALYERVRQAMEQHRKVARLRTYEHLLVGGMCGMCRRGVLATCSPCLQGTCGMLVSKKDLSGGGIIVMP